MKMRTDLNLWPTIAYYAMERLTQAKTKKSIQSVAEGDSESMREYPLARCAMNFGVRQ